MVSNVYVQPVQQTDRGKLRFSRNSLKKYDVTCLVLVTPDVVSVGLLRDNNYICQPITCLVSIAMLGNKLIVGLTFLS